METNTAYSLSPLSEIVAAALPNGKVLDHDGPRAVTSSLFASSETAVFTYGNNNAPLGPIMIYSMRSTSLAALSDAARFFSGPTSPLSDGTEPVDRHCYGEASLLVCPYLNDERQRFLRENKITFVDEAGNAWMEFDGLVVDRRGFKPAQKGNRGVIPLTPDLGFSDSMSLVIRILLDHEGIGVRNIASLASDQECYVSPGQVSKIVSALNNAGYIEKEGNAIRLRRKRELLDEWAAAYRRIHNKDSACFYLPGRTIEVVRDKCATLIGEHGVLTGSAGASLVDHYAEFTAVTVLTTDMKTIMESLEHAGATQTERGWNVCVVYPRYSTSAFWDSRLIDCKPSRKANVASDLQLYLDLTRERQRGSEAAAHLYDRFLREIVEPAAIKKRS